MRRTLFSAAALGLAVVGTLLGQAPGVRRVATTTARPKEFGTQDYTVTVIPAASFASDAPLYTYYGSLFRTSYAGGQHAFAGVQIPSGAIIDFIGVENWGGGLETTLFYLDRYSGTTSGIVDLLPPVNNTYHTDYNDNPLGWQLVRNVHNALVLDVYFPASPQLGWVEIWWKRPVSPPPVSPTFGDVPASDIGYQYIEALAASGITGGCGGGNYCPDANLTRRQMAVFLAKALGLHWPY